MSSKATHAIIIANDLRTGRIVYFTNASDWSESVQDAELLSSDSAQERLAIAAIDETNNLVIDPNLVDANVNAGTELQLAEIREQIRVSGPTILGSNHAATSQAA